VLQIVTAGSKKPPGVNPGGAIINACT